MNLIFPIVSFPFLCSNIQVAPAYGLFISQLRLSFLDIAAIKPISQTGLTGLGQKFNDRRHDQVDSCEV